MVKQLCTYLQVCIKWLMTKNAKNMEFLGPQAETDKFPSTNLVILTAGPS